MMTEPEGRDIEVSAVGMGCLTMLFIGCISVVLLSILLTMTGVGLAQLTPRNIPESVKWASYILRAGMYISVGYATAYRARYAKMAHALFLGAMMMILGAVVFIVPASSAPDFWGAVIWLLTIPLTRLGAQLAISRTLKQPE